MKTTTGKHSRFLFPLNHRIRRSRAILKGALMFAALILIGLTPGGSTGGFVPFAEAKTPPAVSATQNMTPEQIEAAVEEYFDSVGSLNVQRFVDNFAPDGVLEDPVGTPPLQGTSAIGAYFAGIIAPFSQIKPKVQEVIVRGQEAAVNWKLHLTTTTGKKITIDGMGVFKFNQAGKLESVREFFDLEAFLAQLQN